MLTKEHVQSISNWFKAYTQPFINLLSGPENPYGMKYAHSLRVAKFAVAIAESIPGSQEMIYAAQIGGILHDTGRFKQFQKYNTFFDSKSTNHAKLGIEVIEQEKALAEIDPYWKNVIITAILEHNKPSIEVTKDQSTVCLSKILRDADKLDIWSMTVPYYTNPDLPRDISYDLGLTYDQTIAPGIIEDLQQRSFSSIKNLDTIYELMLLQMGWVFDLNFKYSFQYVKDKNFISSVQKVLPSVPGLDQLVEKILKHIVLQINSHP